MPKNGDLQVWWIPQVPMKSFTVSVKNLDEALLLLETLARYDQFQYENKIKPDYCNTGGLQIWDDHPELEWSKGADCWIDWSNEDGESIDDLMTARQEIQRADSSNQRA